MLIFQDEIQQIKELNYRYKEYWEEEFEGRDYSIIIANPENFKENIFYHQANNTEDKDIILKNGFDVNKIEKNNCGLGSGLYLGRDRKSLINFYDPDFSDRDFTIKITGNFNFFDWINNIIPRNPRDVIIHGYDWIRYFDPDATGEEFVLFNIKKASFTI